MVSSAIILDRRNGVTFTLTRKAVWLCLEVETAIILFRDSTWPTMESMWITSLMDWVVIWPIIVTPKTDRNATKIMELTVTKWQEFSVQHQMVLIYS